ncbi:uncharacterized protein OCT59_027830 [Rhizophagus irregularis]|uniref:uncharacterized protein n=1 Tax=Rhizophagus irregularis TaxID=588596 RepID=UPI00332CC06B|nr:hypothetical protein OCT59_027830 [Rhizophagus irregularis]
MILFDLYSFRTNLGFFKYLQPLFLWTSTGKSFEGLTTITLEAITFNTSRMTPVSFSIYIRNKNNNK